MDSLLLYAPILNQSIQEFFETFSQNIQDTGFLEFTAVIFGIMSVWFAKKENILVYPTGIVSVLIYVYILIQPEVKLYADAGINFFYFLMSVYGWIMWSRTDKEGENSVAISKNSGKDWFLSIGAFVVSVIGIIIILKWLKADDLDYWSTNIPYIDSFTTGIFIVAMLLMALKRIENWLFWIIGNVISIPLYMYKGMVFTGFQFLVFLVLAVLGYIEWRKIYQENILNSNK
ncbi:MAG: nicotinamide riboside transporter PnuC [Bacteroidota bacterium]|nr:nicotinamide riboside transporter PnuC [Bacteroidota bacterium]